MSSTTTMKQGDLMPPLTLTCRDGATPLDLSVATNVQVRIAADPDAAPIVDAACVVADQDVNPGQVTYQWQAGDTDTVGTYLIEVVVTWPDGPQTFPARGYVRLVITEDLGG